MGKIENPWVKPRTGTRD